ncbi:YfhO family protein [Clostridium sp.]|uniref:YfhO family protein n=1 Tax=Clostridium sp. TaxID=1506 RepID=UPI00290B8A52|nr:YfhO family protein [Clostridium sp.]MDU5107131.1 YfhO family protein [Clostridium sp.]
MSKFKSFIKDIAISLIIAICTFFLMFLFKKSVLISDLYSQGLDFLEFYKNHLSLFDNSWLYNWNIALGDSTYNQALYYMLSPFNIILILFKKYSMLALLPYFMTFKIMILAYSASLFFKEIIGNKYKWIGTIIYLSCYYIIIYGCYQVMWLDTFIFLPLVLLGIEYIIKNKGKKLFVISLFFFITSNYYMAAIIIPHIAIYGVIRYIYENGNKGIIKYIINMIILAMISLLLCSFVLIPALDVMASSAKSNQSAMIFTNSFKRVGYVFTQNFMGYVITPSNTYITILGMITNISYFVFGKNKKNRLYLIPIGIIFLAIFSDKLNYIFNFGYSPAGGNYRYSVILNIYIGIIACITIKEIIEEDNKKLKYFLVFSGILNLFILLFKINDLGKGIVIANAIVLLSYLSILFVNNKKLGVKLLLIILLLELTGKTFITYTAKTMLPNETRYEFTRLIEHVKETYGNDSRIEIKDTVNEGNIYMAHDIQGVLGYSSLINSSYAGIGQVYSNTSENLVREDFRGRNVIARTIGTKYYISRYNYCPYSNSELVEVFEDNNTYYIFEIDNNYLKYFSENSLIEGSLDNSVIKRDALLYSKLIIKNDGKILDIEELEGEVIKYIPITSNRITIEASGDYYIITPKEKKNINSIDFSINGVSVKASHLLPYSQVDEMSSGEIYLGNLSNGDVLEIPDEFSIDGKLAYIDSKYIEESINTSSKIEIDNLSKENGKLDTKIRVDNDGYILLPIVYDKNWNITIDGEKVSPEIVNGGFMALEVNTGEHIISMVYKSNIIIISMIISMITLFTVIIYSFMKRRK